MAISKRHDRQGKLAGYQVTVQVPNPMTGKTQRRVVGTFLRHKDAVKAETTAKVAIQNGTFEHEKSTALTVAEALNVWIETKKLKITANSAKGYQSAIDRHVRPAFGDVLITGLTHDMIQQQVNQWRDEGMGARLLQRCVMVLRSALDRQVKNDSIPVNPTNGIEKPSARTKKEFLIWTDEEFGRFLAEAEQNRLAPFWFFTAVEGMRRGEALGLRWGDLQWSKDESTCVAYISQTVVPDLANGGRALVQDRAKTKGSQRGVMLTPDTVAVLKAHRDRQRFERQNLGANWSAGDLIVTTTIGTVVTPSTIKRDLAELVRRAGVRSVTTHGLRHMAATAMLRAGVSPALAALKLGHSDIGTTVDRYGHLAATDQETANQAIETAVARARSAVS